jgi:hypothetical protein
MCSGMDARQVAKLRELFVGPGLHDDVVRFAAALDRSPHDPGGLLVVGTPVAEPWHFVAHLSDECEFAGRPELRPTWVRWQVPQAAPPHLSFGVDRLAGTDHRHTLLVVSPDAPTERLLDRVSDARKRGAVIMAMDRSDHDLAGLAHEELVVPRSAPDPCFDVVEHVVTEIAPGGSSRRAPARSRLARFLDLVAR